jgi:hypothetical protein
MLPAQLSLSCKRTFLEETDGLHKCCVAADPAFAIDEIVEPIMYTAVALVITIDTLLAYMTIAITNPY